MGEAPGPPTLAKRLQELVGSVSSVTRPITLISAILFYFGYVYTTTEYGYYGLDVDTIGLSTQEFIMRSPGPLLTPLLGAGLVAAVVALRARGGPTADRGGGRGGAVAAAPVPAARPRLRGAGLGRARRGRRPGVRLHPRAGATGAALPRSLRLRSSPSARAPPSTRFGWASCSAVGVAPLWWWRSTRC